MCPLPCLALPPCFTPLVDKRGPAPVDNGPMALRMQAQDSALFEFVAFCLYLSSAPSFLFRARPLLVTAPRSSSSPLRSGSRPRANAARNLQSPIRRSHPLVSFSFSLPSFTSFHCPRANLSCSGASRVNPIESIRLYCNLNRADRTFRHSELRFYRYTFIRRDSLCDLPLNK